MAKRQHLMILVLALLIAPAAGLAQMPDIPEATKSAAATLSPAQEGEVSAFLKYQADQMIAQAADAKKLIAVRQAVEQAYNSGTGNAYRIAFARQAADVFINTTLASDQPLVQVNAAIAIANLKQATIAPGLQKMMAHGNPAVRLYGVKTYAEIRPLILPVGGQATEGMLTAFRKLGQTESSAPVLAALFKALDFSARGGTLAAVDSTLVNRIRPQAIAIMASTVSSHLQALRNGNEAMMGAFQQAVAAAEANDSGISEEKTALLQIQADILANAGAVYYDAASGAPEGLVDLLRQTEMALGRMTSSTDLPIAQALERPTAERAAAVKLAANKWTGTATDQGLLNAAPWNVKPPKELSKSVATTRAATAPAAPPTATAPSR